MTNTTDLRQSPILPPLTMPLEEAMRTQRALRRLGRPRPGLGDRGCHHRSPGAIPRGKHQLERGAIGDLLQANDVGV
jgi:hypothetical protein